MKYEDRVVCFLDILGFAAHIEKTVNFEHDNEDAIENIYGAFLELRGLLDLDKSEPAFAQTVTQFSDSIVISFRVDEESGVFWTLIQILWIQIALVYRGMLCRGGVARGKLIHTDKALFGPAVIAAYELESKAANYPRVILNDSVFGLGATSLVSHERPLDKMDAIHELVRMDSDGRYYIDYLTAARSELNHPLDYPGYLGCLALMVKAGLESDSPAVRAKHQWMRERLGPHISALKQKASQESRDELADAYLALPDLE